MMIDGEEFSRTNLLASLLRDSEECRRRAWTLSLLCTACTLVHE